MRLDKLTVKAQEAIQAAQSLADQGSHQAVEPEHLLQALLQQQEGVVGPLLAKLGARPEALARQVQTEIEKLPAVRGGAGKQYASQRFEGVINRAWEEAERLKDEYVSTEHLLIAIAQEKGGATGRLLAAAGVTRGGHLPLAGGRARHAARDRSQSRGQVPGAPALLEGPDRAGPQGQARPGHRARRGDPPRDPGALAPDQEQPGADRRARRGQDRHRRRARPAHRGRRRARRGSRTSGWWRWTSAPWSRAPSTAASSRTA